MKNTLLIFPKFIFLAANLFFAFNLCQAQGLIRKIPPKGTWAKYDFEVQLNGRRISKSDSFLEIKNLGPPEGHPGLIQIEVEENYALFSQPRDTTFLIWIDKSDIKQNGDLSKKIKKMWYKQPNQEWLESTGYQSLAVYLADPLKVVQTGMGKIFKNGKIEYQCISMEGKRVLTFFGKDENISFKILYNTLSPFGGVELTATSVAKVDDPKAGPEKLVFTRTVRLKSNGKDARPSFTPDEIKNAAKEEKKLPNR